MVTGNLSAIIAGILLVVAMAMPTMRLLRIVALVAGLTALAQLLLAGDRGIALVLAVLFVLANGARLAIAFRQLRKGGFSREERELLEHVLKVEEPDQQRRLLDLLEWRDVPVGEPLMRQGDTSPPLVYIASGVGHVEHNGKLVGTCGPGDFLGEMSAMLGEPATASVTVAEPMRIARFDRDALAELSRKVPELRRAFDHALNRGLAAKVVRMNRAASQA